MRALLLVLTMVAVSPTTAVAASACELCSVSVPDQMARCERQPPPIKPQCVARAEESARKCDAQCSGKRLTVAPASTHPSTSASQPQEAIPPGATYEQVRDRITERCRDTANPLVDCTCLGEKFGERFRDAPANSKPVSYGIPARFELRCPQKDEAALSAALFKQCEADPGATVSDRKKFCSCVAQNKTQRFLENPNVARSSTFQSEALAACY